MSKVEEKAAMLVLHLSGHQEKKLRASSLEEKLRGLETEEMAAILNFICNKAKEKDLAYLKAYNSLPELLRSPTFNREKLFQLRTVAREKNYDEVLQMLIDLPPQKIPPSNVDGPEDRFLKDVTLGHRKSLARTPQMTILAKLLKDQDPLVIRSLLENPRLTESGVLKIVSLQPTSPRVLEEVFHHAKWAARYRLKKALVCNPSCPPSIAVHLLKFLLLSDLREIAQFENLHLAVKEAADQLLKERKE